MVQKDGEYKVAQYGQWDGYPEGQGAVVLDFLNNEFERTQFERNLAESEVISDEKLNELWKEMGADGSGFVNMDVSKAFSEKYPTLSRDTGARVLHHIQQAPQMLQLDTLFPQDSLFCEWGYVLDLDKRTFEVYCGFNKQPLDEDERFYDPDAEGRRLAEQQESQSDFYYPIRHVRTWAIDDVPSEERFIMQLKIIGCGDAGWLEELKEEYGEDQVEYYRRPKFKPAPLSE
jgi:hypothetical protein